MFIHTHFDLFSFAKSYLRVGQVGVGVHQAFSDYIDFFQVHFLWDKSLWRSDSSHQLAPLFYFRWWQRVNLTIGIHQSFSDLSRSWKLKLIGSQSRYTSPALSKAWNEIVHISVLLFHCLDYPPQIRPGKTGPEKVSGQVRQHRSWKSLRSGQAKQALKKQKKILSMFWKSWTHFNEVWIVSSTWSIASLTCKRRRWIQIKAVSLGFLVSYKYLVSFAFSESIKNLFVIPSQSIRLCPHEKTLLKLTKVVHAACL